MADFLKSKAKHWCCSTFRSKGVFKKYNYKSSHSIGSRKASEKCVSYSDKFPIYESVVQAYLKEEDMKSQSSSKAVPNASKRDNHDQKSTKGLPLKKKTTQVKDFIHKNNICCFVKLSAKGVSKIPSSKQKFKEPCCKTDSSTLSKSPNKNGKCIPCKEHVPKSKGLSSNGVGNKNKQNVSFPDKNSNYTNKSKNRIKSIERKMCVKRKLEVLSFKLEENNNNNNNVADLKSTCKKKNVAIKISKSKNVKNSKVKGKQDISVIPGKRKKREASLNASALVNIYFEKEPTSPKKLKLSPIGSITGIDLENNTTSKEEGNSDNTKKKLNKKVTTPNDGIKKVDVPKEKSCKMLAKLKETNLKKKMVTKQKENGVKTKPIKSKLNAVKDVTKKKEKPSQSLDLKKIKQKLNNIGKSKNHVGILNQQPVTTASKYLKLSTKCAARTDRFCLSWVRQPFSAQRYQSKARWIEGWGNTCCTVAAQSSPEAALLVSQPTQQQLFEEGKSSAVSMQITSPSHLPHGLSSVPHYETASLSQMEPAQVIHIEPVQKITIKDSDIQSDDRPSSVVDVVGAHTPMKPMGRTSVCINSVYPQDSTCVPPCSGYCCSSSERYMPGQYQSMTLGGIGSISTMQMMSYPQPPYRSAFSVPYAHTGLQSYGFYPGNFYQPNPSAIMQQPLHNMNPCLLPHHVPVQVPHAQVKVLIHNPDTSHDCAFSESAGEDGKSVVIDDLGSGKGKKSSNEAKSKNTVKVKKKMEKKTVKVSGEDDCAKTEVVIPQQPEAASHGWSWSGEPEWKLVQNIQVDGPPIRRKCYSAICHNDGDLIHIRDCVLLRSGPRKTDIPFVAKVGAFWEHPDDGEMMMSLLWYYRPEHTEMGRQPHNQEQEIFASKHRDENSVACIEDKAYVLTSCEFARYKAEMCRLKQGACNRKNVVPDEDDGLTPCGKLISPDVDPTTVFLCHQVYDFRQKRILKNPS